MSEMTNGSLLQTLSDDLATAAEQAAQRIVRVEARRANPASGLIWSADGLILTAHHVIEREDAINVVLPDGRTLPAGLVGRDPGSDLALLRVQADGLTAMTAAPATTARIGHLVLAIGRPYGLAATLGVVSSIGGPWRTWRGGQLERLIQTDAPFYPGFSGGALIDASGRLLGLISSQLGRGLNLAVPTDIAAGIVQTLGQHGRVRRGYLGVGTQPAALPESLRQRLTVSQTTGLLVVMIEPAGPADRAGLLLGDILLDVGGVTVETIDDLQARLTSVTVDAPLALRLVRAGELQTLTVTVGERPRA
jgi:S1-C subfamily serine protease